MLIVGLSRVKNEQDIIEPFIRHHAKLFDEILVVDDFSTDETLDILANLAAEGLPIQVRKEVDIDSTQAESTSDLLDYAIHRLCADWIFPLDADEFLEVSSRDKLENILEKAGDLPLELRWENFCWTKQSSNDINPLKNLVYRTERRVYNYKVAIPKCAAVQPNVTLFEGNHLLLQNGIAVRTRYEKQLCIGHFPLRSINQYISKIVFGTARYEMLPHVHENIAYHYKDPLQRLLLQGPAFLDGLESDSRNFSLADGERKNASMENRPFHYLGGELLFTKHSDSVVNVFASFILQLSRRIADQERTIEALTERDVDDDVDENLLARAVRKEIRAQKRAAKAEEQLKFLQRCVSRPKWLAAAFQLAAIRRVDHMLSGFAKKLR